MGFQCFQWLESNNKVTDVYIARQTIVIHLIVVISVHDEQERCRRPHKQRVIEKKKTDNCIFRDYLHQFSLPFFLISDRNLKIYRHDSRSPEDA